MNTYHHPRGFTLIELLVVIAIIGILSAVVLASLNTARNKGNDAAIQSDLDTIRTQAEIYYATNGNYGASAAACTLGMFDADSTIKRAIAGADNATSGTVFCNSSGTAWAVSSQLASDVTKRWCVDSTGFAGQRTLDVSSSVCPAS